jgi:hypothetical protein
VTGGRSRGQKQGAKTWGKDKGQRHRAETEVETGANTLDSLVVAYCTDPWVALPHQFVLMQALRG